MDPVTFRQLLTPSGQEVLQAAVALQPKEPDFLPLFYSPREALSSRISPNRP